MSLPCPGAYGLPDMVVGYGHLTEK